MAQGDTDTFFYARIYITDLEVLSRPPFEGHGRVGQGPLIGITGLLNTCEFGCHGFPRYRLPKSHSIDSTLGLGRLAILMKLKHRRTGTSLVPFVCHLK